ncbi:EcsC family protein [Nocardioides terrisoli]|uniref:EcsC family protein n=1 Tax=Nocardioides terrisoli TaxID=3388267 RepID=UPI00287B8A1B|nr:EcsC family protein [Nocardioides marmorisolisilvae]
MSNLGRRVGSSLAPRVTKLAPEMTSSFVHQALHRAITGVGKLPGAAAAADKQLAEQRGDVDRAIHEVIENHVRYAGAEGFVTNLGGLITMTVTVPANITGLAVVECRMVAGILHLRGYDLEDPRTRTAILTCLLGEDRLLALVKRKRLPGTPMAIATAPVHDPDLSKIVANEVAAELITRVAGKRVAITVGRRVPLVGGLVGAAADAYATWKIGRYVDREFLPRKRR